MLVSPLHDPSDSLWHLEPGFSEGVEQSLVAFTLLVKGAELQPETLRHVLEDGESLVSMVMSAHQRLLLLYLLGTLFVKGGAINTGHIYLSEALDLAEDLCEWGAWAELAYLLGSTACTLFRYTDAHECFVSALQRMQELSVDSSSVDPALEFDLQILLAGCDFAIEEYSLSQEHLLAARNLLPLLHDPVQPEAALAWGSSQLLRWAGSPDGALPLALRACDLYAQCDSLSTSARVAYGRMQAVVAEIALDLADHYTLTGQAQSHASLLRVASQYIEHAIDLADATLDPAGEILSLLARVRYQRAANVAVNAESAFDTALARARRLNDVALLAQTHTALGRDLALRGEHESSLNCYRAVLDVLCTTEVPALGRWARQALIRAYNDSCSEI